MSLHRLAVSIVATILMSACIERSPLSAPGADEVVTVTISGVAQHRVIAQHGLFDLEISGDGQTVQVLAGSTIRALRVSGAHHAITLSPGSSVQHISLAGIGTIIHLPRDIHPAASGSGSSHRILHDGPSLPVTEAGKTVTETP